MEEETQTEDTIVDNQTQTEEISDVVTDNTEEDASAVEANFWDSFEDAALKENGSVRKFKNVEALAKSYVGLQKKLGERVNVSKPPAGATPDQMNAWRSLKRGGIEKIEDYGFVPEKELVGFNPESLGKALFESGADKDLYHNVMKSAYDAEEARQLQERKTREDGEAALRDEWNEDYEVNMKAVKTFVQNRFPEVYKGLSDTDAFRIPAIARMFKQLNELTADGEIRIQKASKESYDERLSAIEQSEAFKNEWHPGYKAARVAWRNLILEQSGRGR